MRRNVLVFAVLLIATTLAQTQVKTVPQYIEQVQALANRSEIKAADGFIDRTHESILREWMAITEINAPSGHEQQRAKYIENLLHKYHLNCEIEPLYKGIKKILLLEVALAGVE